MSQPIISMLVSVDVNRQSVLEHFDQCLWHVHLQIPIISMIELRTCIVEITLQLFQCFHSLTAILQNVFAKAVNLILDNGDASHHCLVEVPRHKILLEFLWIVFFQFAPQKNGLQQSEIDLKKLRPSWLELNFQTNEFPGVTPNPLGCKPRLFVGCGLCGRFSLLRKDLLPVTHFIHLSKSAD